MENLANQRGLKVGPFSGWSSRQISKELFRIFSVYSVLIVFATVYLRYHYTIDVFAGAALALGLLVAAPYLYRREKPSVG